MSDFRGIQAADVTGNVPGRFWNDLLYERNIALFAGPSGVGKSTVVVKIAADLTRSGHNVIYCNAEDDDVMSTFRFKAAGADLDLIRLASYEIPNDIDALAIHIATVNAKLVVFDTADKHITVSSSKWGKALKELVFMLNQTDGCCALFCTHTNKSVPKNADWRAAINGNTAGLTGTARSISLVGARPDDKSQTVVCPVKDQYNSPALAIAFEFETEELQQADGDLVEITHTRIGEKDLTISNPTALVVIQGDSDGKKGPSPEKAAEAAAFLTSLLSTGPHPVTDCFRCVTNPDDAACGHVSWANGEKGFCPGCKGPVTMVEGMKFKAEVAGISWSGAIKRARPHLGIVTSRKGAKSNSVPFNRLPDGHPALVPNAPVDLI